MIRAPILKGKGRVRTPIVVTIRQGTRLQAVGHAAVTVSVADTIAPSVPQNARSGGKTTNSATILWNASTDSSGIMQSGVASYKIRDLGAVVGTVSAPLLTFTHGSLVPGSAHSYTVSAVDASGNESAASSPPVSITTNVVTGGADFTISTGSSSWDGAANNVQPGDIIEISRGSNGTRGPLTLENIVSTGSRIIVRGDRSGLVTIRKSSPGGAGYCLTLTNCHNVDFDFENTDVSGSGASNKCGVKLTYASGSSAGNKDSVTAFCKLNATTSSNLTDDFTLRYLWIDGGWNSDSGSSLLANGIGFSGNHKAIATKGGGRWQENILIEHCFIENVEGEGIYIGSNYSDNSVPLKNIEIANVTVENTGQDGINGKSWWSGVNSVHDCTVIDCGDTPAAQGVLSGIAMMGSTGAVYNCFVSGSGGPGIRFAMQGGPSRSVAEATYGTFATFDCEAYNNEVIDAGTNTAVSGFGIMTNNSSATLTQLVPNFYSNSVSNCRESGFRCANSGEGGGKVQNNISLGNGAPQITSFPGSTAVSSNLTTGITAAACFVDEVNNLHLTGAGETESLGCTGTRGTNYSATDRDGATRPAAAALAKKGAYET